MTTTFDPTLSTDKDRVRQYVGDTGPIKFDVADETIESYLATPMTALRAAAQVAYDLGARAARTGDFTVDDQRNAYSKVAANYAALGDRLSRLANTQDSQATPAASALGGPVIVTGIGDCRGPIDCFNPFGPWFN